MDETGYDLVLRGPEGDFDLLMRWLIDKQGRPCLGDGRLVGAVELLDGIRRIVEEDEKARA